MTIKYLEPQHWEEIKRIYSAGIATGYATFETQVPSWEEWNNNHLTHSRLIAEIDGKVAGWIALSKASPRTVYQGVAEISVYIDPEFQGLGIGLVLLQHAKEESEANGIWTLQASVFEINKASIRLHEKAGFRKVGYRERISQLHGQWHNIILFEKRSKTVYP
ncbi:GNAT family N-acetyltransferase [Pelobium sp.]|nr:GNAT family N-acetyltransferase [Pelobium sp.]MDA9554897.1 GNAT family N-acetyltransferase [Pelobium sp.]